MKLIAEYIDSDLQVIEEKVGGKKSLAIEGVFMQADQKNRNGRVYAKDVLENAVNKYIKEQYEISGLVSKQEF